MRAPFSAYLPFSDGAVELSWSSEGRILALCWKKNPEECPGFHDDQLTLLPWGVERVITELTSFLEKGAPMGPIPWDLLDQTGWTEFQKQVYEAISKIPHGQT